MRYLALATDYDGTIARHGRVDDATWDALARLRASGRRVILVTGRELDDLRTVCPDLDRFDLVVAENGALLYRPKAKETALLCEPPPPAFAERLRAAKVPALSVGHVIVATVVPHDQEVLAAIRDLGLDLQVIFNKESVMVLPSGVNKATGLAAALKELGLSARNVVGVGDGENDHAFLSACECAVAVDDAVPALKDWADVVTRGGAGTGVLELAERMLSNDLADAANHLRRHEILLGTDDQGTSEHLPPYGKTVLVAGPPGGGASTLTAGLLERLGGAGYQFAVIDPEGDFALPGVVVLGGPERAPLLDEVVAAVTAGESNAVVNLLGVPLADRPKFFDRLFPRLLELRGRTGRPHWLVVGGADRLMPAPWSPPRYIPPPRLQGVLLTTARPAGVSKAMLEAVDLFLAAGPGAGKAVAEFGLAAGQPAPEGPAGEPAAGEVLAWWAGAGTGPFRLTPEPPRAAVRPAAYTR